MLSHIQSLKEQELETKKQKQKNMRLARLLMVATLVGLSLFSLLTIISTIEPKDTAEAKGIVPKEIVPQKTVEKDSWELILVNSQHVLSMDFTVDLIKFGNTRVDCRISEPLRKMIDAAKDEGINISVCSGYRSVSEQNALYNAKCLFYVSQGYSEEASKILASQYIQKGGASEHHTGLAVDLLTDGAADLDESFAETPAYAWLKENAAKYGFIERYPKGKDQFTGILWEPWHYRYVGESNAEEIVSKNLCLEEYLQDIDGEP